MVKAPVDPGIYRMVMLKRLFTGSLSILCGFGLIVALVVHGTRPPPIAGMALLIFFVGGGWTLRDGLRMRRDLVRSKNADSDRQQPRPDSRSDERVSGL